MRVRFMQEGELPLKDILGSSLEAELSTYGSRPRAMRVEARLAHREEQYLALLYGPALK